MTAERPERRLILSNARVLTMAAARPRAEWLVIHHGAIEALGDASPPAFDGARTIDCHGAAVLPGFIDAHCHLFGMAEARASLDCGPEFVRSLHDLTVRVGRAAMDAPPGTWVRARNYDEFYLAERRHPTRWDLDPVAQGHPILLRHRNGHTCVLNSVALEWLGIGNETPEPPGGTMERAVPSGEPTGVLTNMEPLLRARGLPELTSADLEQRMGEAADNMLRRGVTSVHDASPASGVDRWRLLRDFQARDVLPQRVKMMISPSALQDFASAKLLPDSGDRQLGVAAVKVYLEQTTGALFPPLEALVETIRSAHALGCQVAVHALEEATVRAAIEAFAAALSHAAIRGRRHRIEHASVCPPELTARLKELGLWVVTQPGFIFDHGERYLAEVPPDERRWLYPLRSLLDAGVPVAAGSDAPVAPSHPLEAVFAAITRRAATGVQVVPEEGIGVREALRAFTVDAAAAAFQERHVGSIRPGKRADLVLLEDDPTGVAADALPHLKVLETIVDGKLMWEHPGWRD